MAKILFLEDEHIIREVLSEYMKTDGHTVIEFADGNEAAEFVANENFDLAVLDINVPGVNGLEILKLIRNLKSPSPGVIMLTAYDDIPTQIEAFNHYADDYITKPASPIILLKRIAVLLSRIEGSAPVQNTALYIDNDAYRAYYHGQDLNLTVSEFLLLKTLAEAPDRVFSREQLILSIYNDEYIGSDRIIDAHIKNIRKKGVLDELETVIGLGYRWRKKK